MKAKPLLFPNADAFEVSFIIDNDFVAVFDRFLDLLFIGSDYVPTPIHIALKNPEIYKIECDIWQTVQIMHYKKRSIQRKTA